MFRLRYLDIKRYIEVEGKIGHRNFCETVKKTMAGLYLAYEKVGRIRLVSHGNAYTSQSLENISEEIQNIAKVNIGETRDNKFRRRV